jgi:biotin synthase
MKLDSECERILDKAQAGQIITRQEAGRLMQVDLQSPEMYALCAVADGMSRRHFDNTGDVCAQIGLDFAPCYGNCGFCVFAQRHGLAKESIEYPPEAVVRAALECDEQQPNAILLMTTCAYDFNKFLDVGRAVREALSDETPLIANIPDFNDEQADALVKAGFCAVYHAVRLNEGKDTIFPIEQRIATMQAAQRAGLVVQTCVEPLGPEHSIELQVESMFLGREVGAVFSGAAHRVSVPGTALAHYGDITHWYLARTVAVSRLVMGDTVVAHCTHEPNMPSLLAGANLLWAEVGANPRDEDRETEKNRGASVRRCRDLLRHAGYLPRSGPSPSVFGPAWEKHVGRKHQAV